MGHTFYSVTVAIGLFGGCLACWELGRRLALWREARAGEDGNVGIGAVEGAVFGLMGLLLAFSFSGAMSRWELRRGQIIEEANDIGTAWLRLDLLPQAAQPELRELFRRYVDSRLDTYRHIPDWTLVQAELARSGAMQQQIWKLAVASCNSPEGDRARVLLLPALNEMFDVTTRRTQAALNHPPAIINAVLILLVLLSSLMAGSVMAHAHAVGWAHMICFGLALSIAIYLVFDLEHPRQGLMRIDEYDQVLVDVRATMN